MVVMPAVEDQFATVPVKVVVRPVCYIENEEELHTSFEDAISDRVMAVHRRLERLRCETTGKQIVPVQANELLKTNRKDVTPLLPERFWLRGMVFVSLALMLLLTGFDLMGLLVLHAR